MAYLREPDQIGGPFSESMFPSEGAGGATPWTEKRLDDVEGGEGWPDIALFMLLV